MLKVVWRAQKNLPVKDNFHNHWKKWIEGDLLYFLKDHETEKEITQGREFMNRQSLSTDNKQSSNKPWEVTN